MKKYWPLLLLPLLLVLWWFLEQRDATPEVHFATVTRARVESTVPTNGKVEPAQWAAARAEIAGVVQSIAVTRGATVKTGQVLVQLDTVGARAELAAALARLKEAQTESQVLGAGGKASQLATVNSSIASAQAQQEISQRNLDALQRLAQRSAATQFQVNEARDAVERAKQQLASFQSQKSTLVSTGDVAVAQARVQDAEASVASARHRLELCTVRSPVDGTVYQFDLKIGAYLQPGELVANVGDVDRVKVTVYVDEPDLGRVAANNPVAITWDARPGRKWMGRVEKLPTQVIALGTRTVGEVGTVIDNPDRDLLPGVTVNATIISQTVSDAIVMPKAALRNLQGASGAFKQDGNKIVWTKIVTGVSDVNHVQVVSGLQPGEKVLDRVVEPSDAEMKNGMRVKAVAE
jgi:HlyD family secretion protein